MPKHFFSLLLFAVLTILKSRPLLAALPLSLKPVTHAPLDKNARLERFAFGSCNRHYNSQKFWLEVLPFKPQLWVWGGDNVYADAKNPQTLKQVYDQQNAQPDYGQFRTQVPLIGIWDDHDYGPNNSDARLPFKAESQALFWDFLGLKKDSPQRLQKGIYSAVTIGKNAQEQVTFILLDNRYFKTKKTLLGEEQWQWLESTLKKNSSPVTFFVLGVPYLFADVAYSEEWGDYPDEKLRLQDLIQSTQTSGAFFLSGDKHFTHILRDENFIEVMASGLTHTLRKPLRPVVRKLYPRAVIAKNWAEFSLDWNRKPIQLSVEIRGENRMLWRTEKFLLKDGKWRSESLF